MKISFRNAVLIAMQAFVLAAVVCGQEQPITITISAPQAEAKAGAPVLLHVVLANLSRQDITVFKSPGWGSAERYYFVSVTDSEGNVTTHGDYILKKEGRAGSRIMVTLKPGDKLEEDATITDMFEKKPAGAYKIVVKRPSPLDPDAVIQSNEITITVVN